MRDVVYFHNYGATGALLTLGAYAVLGAIAAITLRGRMRKPFVITTPLSACRAVRYTRSAASPEGHAAGTGQRLGSRCLLCMRPNHA